MLIVLYYNLNKIHCIQNIMEKYLYSKFQVAWFVRINILQNYR